MRDIQKEIQDNLDAIEKKYNVRVLLAVESGGDDFYGLQKIQ